MDTDIRTLQDLYKISYDAYEESRNEATEIDDLFHNRQYTQSQLSKLANRGQPAETFNVIKMFGRLILGYYSTVVNTVKVTPEQMNDIPTAALLGDVVDYVMRTNKMETEGDKIKLDGILSGLMCSYVDVQETGRVDRFGRKIYKIGVSHVPATEIALDPMSRLEDYSDARYIHRWKWVPKEEMLRLFKNKKKVIEMLQAYDNHLNTNESEFEFTYNGQFTGRFNYYDNYLLVHTIIADDKGDTWSIYWCGDYILSKKKITYKEVKNPYRVQKIHTSNKTEYYGIFREVKETQKAINQALIKIQLMVNTQKIFVEKGGVENIDTFTDMVNRVNAIIPVKSLAKIKVETMSKEIVDQYTIIDRALDRIQRVLGVNDSFLGMAFASDSGRKVKLQQNATALALRYVSVRMEQYYRLLGWDIVNLVKQYFTAEQVLPIIDEVTGTRWAQLNAPLQQWTGQIDPETQMPVMEYVWEEVLDPATGEPEVDKDGNIVIAPVSKGETEIAFTDVDIDIDTVVYNDEDEKNQLMLETVLQGNIGNTLMTVNPSGYLQAASLALRTVKTRYSLDISDILAQTAQILTGGQLPAFGQPPNQPGGQPTQAPKNPSSPSMQLPQNTRSDQ